MASSEGDDCCRLRATSRATAGHRVPSNQAAGLSIINILILATTMVVVVVVVVVVINRKENENY